MKVSDKAVLSSLLKLNQAKTYTGTDLGCTAHSYLLNERGRTEEHEESFHVESKSFCSQRLKNTLHTTKTEQRSRLMKNSVMQSIKITMPFKKKFNITLAVQGPRLIHPLSNR